MEGVIEQLLILCNQLVVIGHEHPEVLIASMLIIFCIAVTIVVCAVAIILCIPYTLIMCLVKLCVWLWHRKHPPKERPVKYKEEEVNYMPVKKAKPSPTPRVSHSAPVSDLPPVYPEWMKQKSGRLL